MARPTRLRRVATKTPSRERVFFTRIFNPPYRIHLLLLLFFTVLVVLLLRVAIRPLPVRAETIARRTHICRIPIRYQSERLLEEERNHEADRAGMVFVKETGWVDRLAEHLDAVLAAAAPPPPGEGEVPPDPPPLPEGITPEDLTVIRAEIERSGREVVARGVAQLVTTLRQAHLCNDRRKPQETPLRNQRIHVVHGNNEFDISGYQMVRVEDFRRRLAEREVPRLFPETPETFRERIAAWTSERLRPSLRENSSLTRQRQESFRSMARVEATEYEIGEVLVFRGEPVTSEIVEAIDHERAAYLASKPKSYRLKRFLGAATLAFLITGMIGLYIGHFQFATLRNAARSFGLGCLLLLAVGSATVLRQAGLSLAWTPLVLVSATVAIAFNQRIAMAMTVFTTLLIAVVTEGQDPLVYPLLLGAFAAIFGAARVRLRSTLFRTAGVTALVHFAGIVAIETIRDTPSALLWENATAGFATGLLAGPLLMILLPLIETLFGVTTGVRLLELSDFNHPLLRRLMMEAPGTYHHSLMVGNLAEAAAEAVGANALLTKVCAHYHDIGKVNKPEYFIENGSDEPSKHLGLAPSMSALIILAHVKDGVEMATDYKLPQAIVDGIRQHHGTTRVEYFYQRAVDRQQAKGETVEEGIYRYPGPKPQYPEMGILMLADSCESAARALADHSPAHVESLVEEIIRHKVADGQLDMSGLTLTDLAVIRRQFIRILAGIYHARIKYPKPDKPEAEPDETLIRPEDAETAAEER